MNELILIYFLIFRMYCLEKIKYDFRENKAVTDKEAQTNLIKKAKKDLDVIKRQVI